MCFVYECAFANRILITIWCLQQDAILWLPFFCFLPAENKYRSDKKKKTMTVDESPINQQAQRIHENQLQQQQQQ